MRRLLRPSLIYKYKPYSNGEDEERLEEILTERKLYFPTLKQLNDPMEACAVNFGLQIAGCEYHFEAGKIHPVVENIQELFGILSFTAVPNSPIMWAHYGSDYTGCCLIISSSDTFSNIEPTLYSDICFGYSEESLNGENIEEYVREALYYKDTDWAYENEWRYIEYRKTEKISLAKNDIKGVIIGENMDQDKQDQIASICKTEGIPCFKTYVMRALKAIGVVPVEYRNGFITRREIDEYMEKKKNENKCVSDEYDLFYLLNSGIGWE
ncbi:MAG: DUF2971 domain-containing protein [Oscillospiraceae bacterium]|nr:DUF2971 domain-containing protein [Oscillospiraceae bacterium]